MNESYHSRFGAIQEAYHVFIHNGLDLMQGRPVAVMEIGFGTGLNAFITYIESLKNKQQINYTGVEAYPVAPDEAAKLNYARQLDASKQEIFDRMHSCLWGEEVKLNEKFTLTKRKQRFEAIDDSDIYDLIYFDAFGYHAQPELWSVDIFKKMHKALKKDGVLVTYACRTIIKNAMKEAGFITQKLPGPPGKREMLRSVKV